MTYKVRLTPEAEEDLDRRYGFLLEKDLDVAGRGSRVAGRALEAI